MAYLMSNKRRDAKVAARNNKAVATVAPQAEVKVVQDPFEVLAAEAEKAEAAIKAAKAARLESLKKRPVVLAKAEVKAEADPAETEGFESLFQADEVRRAREAKEVELRRNLQSLADLKAQLAKNEVDLREKIGLIKKAKGLGLAPDQIKAAQAVIDQIKETVERQNSKIKKVWGVSAFGLLPKLGELGWTPEPGTAEAKFVAEAGSRAQSAIGTLRTWLNGVDDPQARTLLVEAEEAFGQFQFSDAQKRAETGTELARSQRKSSKGSQPAQAKKAEKGQEAAPINKKASKKVAARLVFSSTGTDGANIGAILAAKGMKVPGNGSAVTVI